MMNVSQQKNVLGIGVLLLLIGAGVTQARAENFPHDTTGRQFPAFLYENEESSEQTNKTPLTQITSTDLKMKARKKGPDGQGSQVKSVYTFTVDVKENLLAPDKVYVVVYYLDDEPMKQFEKVRLPFSFTMDYRGHRSGSHTVKLDIEDTEGNLLATQKTNISITP
ncbi:MAG: hypothetical protein K8I00_05010 [Candidatus Omnitrophica bacterium]|nr:hypothetical protein [Candidatus Omnitrophota bacterium]